jgi:hypothetical protein
MIELIAFDKHLQKRTLDVDQNVVIALTMQFLSLTDIEKRTGDYTKGFPLPKTHRNMQYFGTFGIPSDIGGNWDSRFEAPVWLLEETNIIIEGSLRLESTQPSHNRFNVSISGRSFSIKSTIGDLLMSDIDMSDWALRVTQFILTWDGTYNGGHLIYSCHDVKQGYGQYVKEGDPAVLTLQNIKDSATPLRVWETLPAFRLNELLRRLFQERSLIVGGSWFSEPEVEEIYIQNTNPLNPFTPSASNVHCEVWALGGAMVGTTPAAMPFWADPSHPNWNDGFFRYECTLDGAYFWDLRVQPTQGTPLEVYYTVAFYVNGLPVGATYTYRWDQGFAVGNRLVNLLDGDVMSVVYWLDIVPTTFGSFVSYGGTDMDLDFFVSGSQDIDPSEYWSAYKQIDFLRAFTQIFNVIIWMPDTENVRLDTWDYYMATYGEKKDWSDKLDISTVVTRPINGELRNPINLSLSEGQDIINKDYFIAAGRTYGNYWENTNIPFTQAVAKDIDLFTPGPTQDIISTDPVANFEEFIIHKFYSDVDNISFQSSGLQLYYYNGLRTVDTFYTRNEPGAIARANTEYPYFSNFRLYSADSWQVQVDTLDLNFTFWTPPITTGIIDDISEFGLYNRYFREMLRERYDEANKIIEAMFVLNTTDIANFSFADTILITIGGTPVGLKILEITDYSPSRTRATKVKAMLTFIR